MSLLQAERSIVVVIDMQGKLMELVHRPLLVRQAAGRLMEIADLFSVPVVVTEQYPRGIGPTHADLQSVFDGLSTPRRRIEKESFGCCGEPSFEQALADLRPELAPSDRQLVIVGIEAHICVVQTTMELLAAGAQVYLCWEGVSGRGEEHRHWALRRMEAAGASVTNLESVGFEWARDKSHPRFKELSGLLKGDQLG